METPLHLYAEFTAIAGQGDAVAELVARFSRQVAEEPGNGAFSAHRLRERPDRFFVFETYHDQDAFQAHGAADHTAAFTRALLPLIQEDAAVLTFLGPAL